jgi:hypothetical protein
MAGELALDVLWGAGLVSGNNRKCVVLCVPNHSKKTGLVCTHQDQLPARWRKQWWCPKLRLMWVAEGKASICEQEGKCHWNGHGEDQLPFH